MLAKGRPRALYPLHHTHHCTTHKRVACPGVSPATPLGPRLTCCTSCADHDVALGIEDIRFGRPFPIGADDGSFNAEREVATFQRGCPAALNIHTGQIDAGMIYGTNPEYLRETLRLPNSCDLRASGAGVGEFPPVTTRANAQGQFFFLAGDIRIIEHSFLFSQHTVRHPSRRANRSQRRRCGPVAAAANTVLRIAVQAPRPCVRVTVCRQVVAEGGASVSARLGCPHVNVLPIITIVVSIFITFLTSCFCGHRYATWPFTCIL